MNTTMVRGHQTIRYASVIPTGAVQGDMPVSGKEINRQEAIPRRPGRMPNGDPDRLMLWGSEWESGPVGGRR